MKYADGIIKKSEVDDKMKNTAAVSAVIGVILMVAITVILAVVITALVFELNGASKLENSTVIITKNITIAYVDDTSYLHRFDLSMYYNVISTEPVKYFARPNEYYFVKSRIGETVNISCEVVNGEVWITNVQSYVFEHS